MAASELILPYKFAPRDYQLPFLRAMDGGCLRAVLVWHRRGGKDLTALNAAIKLSTKRPGNYYYYFPTAKLGREIIWEGKTNDEYRFLDFFPPESVARKNDTEMVLETSWGALFRILGTDNLDVVGPNPVGVIFSEYSKQDPHAWTYVQPILRANDGWAIFCYTPRGRNHGYDLFQTASANRKEWFCQKLTIEDTFKDLEHRASVISVPQIRQDIADGLISEPLAEQEYWCSFELGQEGSYYGQYKLLAERENRIGFYDYDPSAPVYRFADLGKMYTAAIDVQFIRSRVRIIGDYWDNQGQGAPAFAKSMNAQPYVWGSPHFAGPDMEGSNAKSFQTGKTQRDTLLGLGYKFRSVIPHRVDDGLEAVRVLWPKLEINASQCKTFLQAVDGYRAAINAKLSTDDMPVYTNREVDSWENHMCDALRHLAVAWRYMAIGGQYLGDNRMVASCYESDDENDNAVDWVPGRYA